MSTMSIQRLSEIMVILDDARNELNEGETVLIEDFIDTYIPEMITEIKQNIKN